MRNIVNVGESGGYKVFLTFGREDRNLVEISIFYLDNHKMSKLFLLDPKVAEFMQLNMPTYEGATLITYPLLLRWWRLYFRSQKSLDQQDFIYPDDRVKNLFWSDFIFLRSGDISWRRLSFSHFERILRNHIEPAPLPPSPEIIQALDELEEDLNNTEMEIVSLT